MLVLKVKPGEFVQVGDMRIGVHRSSRGTDVRLCFDGPKSIKILRCNVKEKDPKK